MKKLFYKTGLLFFILLNSLFAKGQYVAIPDTNFVNWLNANGYASCMTGNLIDTTCSAVVNATSLNCYYSGIYDLDGMQYFDNLNYLNCGGNKLVGLPTLPQTLDTLMCSYNKITQLPSLPALLIKLDCSHNKLSAIPSIPGSLLDFNCSNNQLHVLPGLPSSLLYLNCSGNPLNSIFSFPDSLKILFCGNDSLVNLPALPATLISLDCRGNQLTNIPVLPSTLVDLNCRQNLLTTLPSIPLNLDYLDCASNQISSLPAMPLSLNYLNCSHNLLTYIPPLDYMDYLDCSHNQLIYLPLIDMNLIGPGTIICSYNQINAMMGIFNLKKLICDHNLIPALDPWNEFGELNCSNNLITSLSAINLSYINALDCSNNLLDSLPSFLFISSLNISYNPNLSCLPRISWINNFTWNNTAISCLPNAFYVANANPSIAGIPLCQPASGCNYYWNMYGNVFNDLNSNCIINNGEASLRNIPLKLDSGSVTQQIFYSNNEGYYSFETGLGNYEIKIDTTGIPFNVVCPAGNLYNSNLTVTDSSEADLNFGLQCKPGYLDLISSSIAPSAQLRPGAFRTLFLYAGDATRFYGISCATGITGTVKAILDGPVSYISAAPGALAPSVISGDTITWNVADFSLSDPDKDFNIQIQIDTTATSNDTICITLEINSGMSEVNYANNIFNHCFPVVNSFDPNAKEAYPAGLATPGTNEIRYIIYFQNTGNAPAENIYIIDSLDAGLDEHTFKFISSSHNAVTQLMAGNILRFSFPGINLPDSNSNEPGSHGYVQFKINRDSFLLPNDIISNIANIYFDFNSPIVTNEVTTLFNFDISVLNSFIISDSVICMNEIITAQHNIPFPVQIHYNWLLDSILIGTTSSISISGLSPGQHLLTLTINVGNNQISSSKSIYVFPVSPKPLISFNGDTLTTGTAQSYQWYLFYNPIFGATQNSLVIPQNGWYNVQISDSNGCSIRSDSVYACKSSFALMISDTVICTSESLTAQNITGSPYSLHFNWLLDSISIDTTSSVTISGLLPGLYQLTLIINGGTCSATTSRSIQVFPDHPKPIIYINGNMISVTSAQSYQWYLNSIPLPGATSGSLVIPQSGWYSILRTDSNGCSALSDSIYVNGVGITDYENTSFNIFPNPATETITISTPSNYYRKEIETFNSLGEIVYKNAFSRNRIIIDLHNFLNGLYLVKVKFGNSYSYQKFIKE